MKRLIETVTEKWPNYLLETFVITFGILLAFGLNNWNEGRKSNVLEKDSLEELRIALNQDLGDLEFNIGHHKRTLRSQNLVVNWLNSDLPYTDSICYQFTQVKLVVK